MKSASLLLENNHYIHIADFKVAFVIQQNNSS
jgi:hypothetical protein